MIAYQFYYVLNGVTLFKYFWNDSILKCRNIRKHFTFSYQICTSDSLGRAPIEWSICINSMYIQKMHTIIMLNKNKLSYLKSQRILEKLDECDTLWKKKDAFTITKASTLIQFSVPGIGHAKLTTNARHFQLHARLVEQ